MQDPIADMFTRIRNGQTAHKQHIECASTKVKVAIAKVLLDEGYITEYNVSSDPVKPVLTIVLKYYQGRPVIEKLERVSKLSRRVYKGAQELVDVLGGLGISIVSTSKGVMSGSQARGLGLGGEVLARVA